MNNPFKPGSPSYVNFEKATPEVKAKLLAAAKPQAKGGSLAGLAKDKAVDAVAGDVPGYIPAAVIASTALSGKAAMDMLQGKTPEGASGKYGRAQLGVATGGLSELANMFGFGHKSTRDVASGHTKELQGQGVDNAAWQQYVSGMRKQYDSAPTDPSKPFAGKYDSWDAYKTGGLEAPDLAGVYGNLSTFGPDWANYSDQQRQDITQTLIDNNLYDSQKGEVIVTDPEKAKQLAGAKLSSIIPKGIQEWQK